MRCQRSTDDAIIDTFYELILIRSKNLSRRSDITIGIIGAV